MILCLVMNMSSSHIPGILVAKTSHCILILNNPQGERTDNGSHVLYSASNTSLFLLQCHGNYFDAQFKMITPIIEGNARGVCLIDNKGAV